MDLWDSIQAIRSDNDTSFDRWPPHINLLWPFLPQTQFAEAEASITSSPRFSAIKPFTIRLSTFSYTLGSKYVHLIADIIDRNTGEPIPWPPIQTKGKQRIANPTTPMQDLFQTLITLFPGCERPFLNDDGSPSEHFIPHLSVGQFDQTTIKATVQSLQANWTPIEFEVTELSFLARAGPNKPFQTILTIPFNDN
jgi:poly(A) polymerase